MDKKKIVHGYIPIILLISLVLASPVPWKRKLIALATGLHGYDPDPVKAMDILIVALRPESMA